MSFKQAISAVVGSAAAFGIGHFSESLEFEIPFVVTDLKFDLRVPPPFLGLGSAVAGLAAVRMEEGLSRDLALFLSGAQAALATKEIEFPEEPSEPIIA